MNRRTDRRAGVAGLTGLIAGSVWPGRSPGRFGRADFPDRFGRFDRRAGLAGQISQTGEAVSRTLHLRKKENEMKKRLLLVLGLCLMMTAAFTLAGCGDDKGGSGDSGELDPYKIYNEAAKKMADCKDMQANTDIKMQLETGGESFDMNIGMDIKEVMKSEKDVQMASDISMKSSLEDIDMDMKMWYKDGWMYIDSSGTKAKQKVDVEEAISKMNARIGQNEVTEDMVSDASAEKDGDLTNVVFKIKKDKVQEMMSTVMSSGDSSVTDIFQNMGDVKTGDMTISAVIDKDGNMTDIKMKGDVEVTANNQSGKTGFEITMNNIQVDQGLKIDFPNFDDFTEASV